MAVRLVNEPVRETAGGNPLGTQESRGRNDYIRGHLSPVYIHERKALSDCTVGISDEA